jgi:hypothetical protein
MRFFLRDLEGKFSHEMAFFVRVYGSGLLIGVAEIGSPLVFLGFEDLYLW